MSGYTYLAVNLLSGESFRKVMKGEVAGEKSRRGELSQGEIESVEIQCEHGCRHILLEENELNELWVGGVPPPLSSLLRIPHCGET
jgi:hypothetical protein